ncbi:molybdenum cofactor sulfurase [Azorhizobium oxalatiphilum]|uniref:Molybdenum cofactor sulfurase n=1 Tax=Azorhizobium oxalatiphilum TaxID=980631 RepID=A0A917FJL3_9HYPH|nr:MOSC domain-containing protein [Azorhizobium oxalatiphilum]GGF89146.1 molybdenum cofactor sulfurase [Azorhizobium oxalatiphilum]
MTAELVAIHRYPVKGLSHEVLGEIALQPGTWFPGDRIHAIENGPSGFDAANPEYRPKTAFLVLMRDEQLAALDTRYDQATSTLTVAQDGRTLAEGDLSTPEGCAAIEAFFTAYMGDDANGPLKVLSSPEGHRFTDSLKAGFVSLLNLASVRDLETRMGTTVDPIRFRMNLLLDGWEAGSELEMAGRVIAIGETVRLQVLKRTVRCAATNVNPDTAQRDLNVVKGLAQAYGHADCGIYAKVLSGGTIRPGDAIRLADGAPAPKLATQPRLL